MNLVHGCRCGVPSTSGLTSLLPEPVAFAGLASTVVVEMDGARIAVVEDDEDIAEALRFSLKMAGYEVLVAYDGVKALSLIRNRPPQLVLLDLMIPGMDGFELCQALKCDRLLRDVPIIMLTARSEETDVVLGLGLGADDYVAKPFSTPELLARIRAVITRGSLANTTTRAQVVCHGDLVVDGERFEARLLDKRVELTATEFKILQFLARNAGQAFTRDEILNHTIGEQAYVIDRNVDVHVRAIRKKLELPHAIRTIRGVGYRFESAGCRSTPS